MFTAEISCHQSHLVCAGQVSMEQQARGQGFISHPAVIDNCMQLGPALGALDSLASRQPALRAATRVVAGLHAFTAVRFPSRGLAFAAAEMLPPASKRDVLTSHWLIGDGGQKSLVIRNIEVRPSQGDDDHVKGKSQCETTHNNPSIDPGKIAVCVSWK